MVRVTELWRHPVKSMRGERVESAAVTSRGLEGDRRWGILDVASGRMLTARRQPELLTASARLVGDDVAITLPDGTEVDDDASLSTWLGREVALVEAADDLIATYETQLNLEETGDWVTWKGPAGSFHDSTRTQVSLASSATIGAAETVRFRINIIVDGTDARAEDALVGKNLMIGEADPVLASVSKQIDRCIVVTRPQPGGVARDLDILKTLHRDHEGMLGIALLIDQPGRVDVGDSVRIA